MTLHFELVSPERLVRSGTAYMVTVFGLRRDDGDMEVASVLR